MASFSERRQTVRVAVSGSLNVESMSMGQPLRLVEVGAGGFSARSPVPVPLDVVASYRFTTPGRHWSAIFDAKAIYNKPETDDGSAIPQYLIGFIFTYTESPTVQRLLLAMMDHARGFVSFS